MGLESDWAGHLPKGITAPWRVCSRSETHLTYILRCSLWLLGEEWTAGGMGRSRQTVRGCCRHPEERWRWRGLGGGSGGGGLWTDS